MILMTPPEVKLSRDLRPDFSKKLPFEAEKKSWNDEEFISLVQLKFKAQAGWLSLPGVSSMRGRKKSQWLSMRDIFLREETGFEPDTSTARRSRSTISASTYIFQIYMNAEKYFWNGQIGAWTISR